MKNINNSGSEKGIVEQLFDKIKNENSLYAEKTHKEKEKYWVGIMINIFHNLENGEKIDISIFRNIEPKIDLFLNEIINNIESYHWESKISIIDNYFILDEQAKRYLASEGSYDIKGGVESILN